MTRIELYLLICVVYNLVGAFLGLATMLRGESLSARVDSQCAEKNVKMCRTCVGSVGGLIYFIVELVDEKNLEAKRNVYCI